MKRKATLFTGLIRHFGEIVSFSGELLTISSDLNPALGDSIAINGACLTAIKSSKNNFGVQVSDESKKTIATSALKGRVHLEPALKVGDRLDGHFMQGHIDSIGKVASIIKESKFYKIDINIEPKMMKYMIPKGSVGVDGVSLTINRSNIKESKIELTIIPHTFENTIFCDYKEGREVNIESDLLARAVVHLASFKDVEQKGSVSPWDYYDKFAAIY